MRIPGKYLSLLGLVAQPELSKDFPAAIALTHGTELGERMRNFKVATFKFPSRFRKVFEENDDPDWYWDQSRYQLQ